MKHIALFFSMIFLINTQCVLSQPTTHSRSPLIVFDKNVYDYDTIVQGANGDCVFRFTNIGDAPLVIADVNASCGCTKPRWDKKPVMPAISGGMVVACGTTSPEEGIDCDQNTFTITGGTVTANGNNQVLRIKGFVRQKCRKQI